MSFIRFSSRCLLSGYFVADGLKAAINPEPLVDEAEPYATTFTSYVDKVLPVDVSQHFPRKTVTLVRLHGIIQATGALMMATGLFRRLGAAIVAVSYLPKVMSASPSSSDEVLPFTRELALLGGVLVETGKKGKSRSCGCCHKKNAPAPQKTAVSSKKNRQADALKHALSTAAS